MKILRDREIAENYEECQRIDAENRFFVITIKTVGTMVLPRPFY